MTDEATKRGKGQTSADKGFVERMVDAAADAWASATAPIENTGGQARADAIDAAVTAQTNQPKK